MARATNTQLPRMPRHVSGSLFIDPGGRSDFCVLLGRDRCGKPIIHTRDIGDRVSPARTARMTRQNKSLQRTAGGNARQNSRQTAEVAMLSLDHWEAT